MNGREIKGRYIKVDYDSKSTPRSSYKINTETERNRLYNREPLKLEQSKRIKKDRERDKLQKLQRYRKPGAM
jgi:hypothetical protein